MVSLALQPFVTSCGAWVMLSQVSVLALHLVCGTAFQAVRNLPTARARESIIFSSLNLLSVPSI